MTEYQSTSRRPIAQMFRRTADNATKLCLRFGISADAISYSSILASLIASLCFLKSGGNAWLLIFAPLFCYLRLWLNMLDGMVAVGAGRTSARGELVNDLPDRLSDIMIFAGVAHSGMMNPVIAYWAAIFSLLTAYVGLFGQAIGRRREFGGIMSKPWRMVALGLGAWTTFAYLWWSKQPMDGTKTVPPILDCTCLIIIAGCLQTIIVRVKRIMTGLQDEVQ
jgi:phosphatidylglycerophosphate synthase